MPLARDKMLGARRRAGIFYQVFRGVCPLANLDEPEVARIHVTM
jgi:hypothetical protein